MRNTDFNPLVRFVNLVTNIVPYATLIMAYDYRMFYVSEGTFDILFENNSLTLTAGDMLTIPPGTAYRLNFTDALKPKYYILNFDFDSNSSRHTARPPVPVKEFDTSDIFSAKCITPYEKILLVSDCYDTEPYLREIYQHYEENSTISEYVKSSLLKYILAKSAMKLYKTAAISKHKFKLISEIKAYIANNIETKITNETISNHFGYHPYYLSSLFEKSEGITLHKYIEKVKLNAAKDMLTNSDYDIHTISEKCGFEDTSYFCRFFRRNMSITPNKYRKFSR